MGMSLRSLLLQDVDSLFDVDPWPQCALARDKHLLTSFRYMTPDGGGNFKAVFKLSEKLDFNQLAVHYANADPVFLPMTRLTRIMPRDELTMTYTP